jgi:peptidoglycan/xylan/chitin deacetylase (PgdA/CDA1 family)
MTTATLARGACVISIDTELAWGLAHRRDAAGEVQALHRFDLEREVIGQTLDVFARHDIAATWAMVGHLFLDHCEPDGEGRLHPEVVQPTYDWLDADWLAIDPCSTLDEAPFFYGRDIVEQIAACPVEQEIASHAFSHVMANEPGCSAEVFASELAASRKVAADAGVDLRSFVFPRTSINHLGTLAAAGFSNYRGKRPVAFPGLAGWRRRALSLVDQLRPLSGSAVQPAPGPDGLWNIPQTYLFAPATSRSRLPVNLWCVQPIARLQQAVRERSLFHLYFHPYNITAAPERAIAALDRICAAVARARDRGGLDVVTMGDLTERLSRGN